MKCNNCGKDNPPVKKCCQQCGDILEGTTLNNVTGEPGYRGGDGVFYSSKEESDKRSLNILNDLPDSSVLLFQKNADGTFSPLTLKKSHAELFGRFLSEFSKDDPFQKLEKIKLKQL